VANQDNHLRQVNTQLEELRKALVKLRAQLSLPSSSQPRTEALEAMQQHVNALRTYARLLQSDVAETQRRLEQAEREAWDLKARRADATAKLKGREQLLAQIQNSAAWKIVKPVWKLFRRAHRRSDSDELSTDVAFAFDLPKRWVTNRDILLVKGWCFSRSGRQIAGIRAKVGRKAHLARYGLPRPDVAASFRAYPEAQLSGFTIELKFPPGTTTIQLEAIEQGAEWEAFFKVEVRRESRSGEPDTEETTHSSQGTTEKILKFSSLSASKAFELVKPGFHEHARRVGAEKPAISIITPTHNTKPEWIAEAALSVLNQTFENWEWCIVDDHSEAKETTKILEALRSVSPRVRIASAAGRGISAATNEALDLASGRHVCFLDHDDLLHPRALEAIHAKLDEGFQVVYSDEDKLDDGSGDLIQPFFKPDWSPEYFRGAMYVGHLLCVERELATQTRFDADYDGVQDFEFMLRLSERGPRIGHVPEILYHWRKTPGSIAENTEAKPRIGILQERAVNAHLERLQLPARAEQAPLPHRLRMVPATRNPAPRISIIIPTRDAPDVLARCLKSIFEKTSWPDFEVIVMDNDTTDPDAVGVMEKYPLRRIAFPGRFNFSRANNQGAAAATGELLVFLNNDTEIISNDWLEHLAYYAEQADVGAAGALLAYDDRTVQHAGVALGMRGTADHVMRRFPIDLDGYAGNLACAREVSVTTAACLMIRAPLFHEIGGFNEHFFTAYQDVDICLRLRARSLRIVLTPRALLLHHEFVSRPQSYYDMIDRVLLLDLWEAVIDEGDPYYNRNLDLVRGDYSRRSA
jgi:GT2 family glycosyltransferase